MLGDIISLLVVGFFLVAYGHLKHHTVTFCGNPKHLTFYLLFLALVMFFLGSLSSLPLSVLLEIGKTKTCEIPKCGKLSHRSFPGCMARVCGRPWWADAGSSRAQQEPRVRRGDWQRPS